MLYAKPTDFTCTTNFEYDHLFIIWHSVMSGELDMEVDEFDALCAVLEAYEDSLN